MHQEIDPLLFSDYPDISDEESAAAPQSGIGWHQFDALEVRAIAHNENAVAAFSAAFRRQPTEGLIGDNRDVRHLEREAFKQEQHAVGKAAATEFRLEDFGGQIVLIEDVALAKQLEHCADHKDRIGRIAALYDVEPASSANPASEHDLPEKRIRVLDQISDRPFGFDRKRVTIDRDPFEHFVSQRIAPSSRADDRYLVSLASQGAGLLPDSPIERNWQVLDDDEDSPPTGMHDV